MEEKLVYLVLGIMAYAAAYIVVSQWSTAIWKLWAFRKVGMFWEYSCNCGMRQYYPGMYHFIMDHNALYSVLYAVLWPYMIPMQLIRMTKILNWLTDRRYWR